MKHNVSITILTNIFLISCSLYASDQHYDFNDFDKEVFTNHSTSNVELIYPTPLIESVRARMIEIKTDELESLLSPALTRLLLKQKALALQNCNSHGYLAKTHEDRELIKQHREKKRAYYAQLQTIYDKIKTVDLLPFRNQNLVKIFTNDLMLIVQYAVYKIEYFSDTAKLYTGNPSDRQATSVGGNLKALLDAYRHQTQNYVYV